MTQEDARKESCGSLEDFKRKWKEIYGSWNPNQTVTAYEFKVLKKG